MNTRTKYEMEAMDRVDLFGGRGNLSLTPKLTQLFATVGASLGTLRAWGEGQISGAQSRNAGIEQRRGLLKEIRLRMQDISDVAKSMEEEGTVGIAELFRVPRKPRCEDLILAAETFAERAQAMIAEFTERGLAPSFIAELQAKIAAYRAATEVKLGGKANLSAATAGVKVAAAEGMKAIRVLRLLMRIHLRSKPGLLTAWVLAARVERSRSKAQSSAEFTPTQTFMSHSLNEGAKSKSESVATSAERLAAPSSAHEGGNLGFGRDAERYFRIASCPPMLPGAGVETSLSHPSPGCELDPH